MCFQIKRISIESFVEQSATCYLEAAKRAFEQGEALPLAMIRSIAHCCSEWNCKQSGVSSLPLYHACRKLFFQMKEIPSLCPLQVVITELFPLLVGASVGNEELIADLEQIMRDVYAMGTEEACMLTAEMISIAFSLIPNYTSFALPHTCILRCLRNDMQGIRKFGVAALRSVIQNVRMNTAYQSIHHVNEHIWNTYISIYETFDEFPVHLIRDVWSRIHPVHRYCESLTTSAGEKDGMECQASGFPQLGEEWIEVLFTRGLQHSNPQVRQFVTAMLLTVTPLSSSSSSKSKSNAKSNAKSTPISNPSCDHNNDHHHHHKEKAQVQMFVMTPSFLLNTLLPSLNDSILFKGDRYGVGYLLTDYLLHYPLQSSAFCLDLLRALTHVLTNPSAMQFVLGSLEQTALPRPPRLLGDTVNAVGTGSEFVTADCIDRVQTMQRVSWRSSARKLEGVIPSLLAAILSKVSRKSLQMKLMRSLFHLVLSVVTVVEEEEKENLLALASILNAFPFSLLREEIQAVQQCMSSLPVYPASFFSSLLSSLEIMTSSSTRSSVGALVVGTMAMQQPMEVQSVLRQFCQEQGEQNVHMSCSLLCEVQHLAVALPFIPADCCSACIPLSWMEKTVQKYMQGEKEDGLEDVEKGDIPIFTCFFSSLSREAVEDTLRTFVSAVDDREEKKALLSPRSLRILKIANAIHPACLPSEITLELLLQSIIHFIRNNGTINREVRVQAIENACLLISSALRQKSW